MTTKEKPKSFLGKVFWLIRNRPSHVFRTARGISLFWIARICRSFGANGKTIQLGQNVRLQKNSCLMAEAPNAEINIDDDCIVYENAKIDAYGAGHVSIGPKSILGDIRIAARYDIRIGKRFLSSWNVFIQDYDSHPIDPTLRAKQVENMVNGFTPRFDGVKPEPKHELSEWNFPGEPISIGDDVWMGANVTILKGARIGNGCIVATGAVVLKGEYPDGSVIAGNPAKVIK